MGDRYENKWVIFLLVSICLLGACGGGGGGGSSTPVQSSAASSAPASNTNTNTNTDTSSSSASSINPADFILPTKVEAIAVE